MVDIYGNDKHESPYIRSVYHNLRLLTVVWTLNVKSETLRRFENHNVYNKVLQSCGILLKLKLKITFYLTKTVWNTFYNDFHLRCITLHCITLSLV
jgi:hypothetical protein